METITDLITGRQLPWSEEEPARQQVEAILLKLGYRPEDIEVGARKELEVEGEKVAVTADLLVKPGLVIRCAPGSVSTRRTEVLAAGRLLGVALAMASNGTIHELLATATGRVLAAGDQAIPAPAQLRRLVQDNPPAPLTPARALQAVRIYQAMRAIRCELG